MQLGSPTGLFGAERWILALIKYLDKSKINIFVSAIKDSPDLKVPLCSEADSLGISTKIFEAYGKFNFRAIKFIRDYIKNNNIHILHTHAYKQDIIGLFATIGTNCKIVSTPHGWSKKADFKLMCYETLNRAIFPFFDAVVPLSKELYNSLKRIPFLKSKLYLIENGVDIDEIKNINKVAPEVKKYRDQGSFIIGYIGQLIPRKGLDILFTALKDIAIPNWHLFVLGDGEQMDRLKRMASNFNILSKIHFTGFRQDRLSYLKGFDVFVLPSRLEGIPRCLMEAGAMGKAILASDIPGCRDVIIHNKTGLLFHPEDPKSLKENLLKLYKDKQLRDSLGQHASQFIKQKYSARRMALEYETLYFKLT